MSPAFAVDMVEGPGWRWWVEWFLFFLIHRRGGYFGVLGAVFDRRVAAAHVPFALEGEVFVRGTVLMVGGAVALDLQFWSWPCWWIFGWRAACHHFRGQAQSN